MYGSGTSGLPRRRRLSPPVVVPGSQHIVIIGLCLAGLALLDHRKRVLLGRAGEERDGTFLAVTIARTRSGFAQSSFCTLVRRFSR